MRSNQRRDKRYPAAVHVIAHAGRRVAHMTTGDVSLRGMFVCVSDPLPVNLFVRFELQLPGTQEPLTLMGRVCYALMDKQAGNGIQFYGNGAAQLERWERFVHDVARRQESPPLAAALQRLAEAVG